MKIAKALVLAQVCALGLSVTAATWFDAKINTYETWPVTTGLVGGSWENPKGATLNTDTTTNLVLDAEESAPLRFKATEAKTVNSDISSADITSKIGFTACEALPDVPANAKAAVVVLKTGDTTFEYYGLAKKEDADENEWVDLGIAAAEDVEAVVVTHFTDATPPDDNQLSVTYTIDGASVTKTVYVADKQLKAVNITGSGTLSSLSSVCDLLGFKVMLTWDDANVTNVNYSLDGATAVAYASGTELTATTSVRFYPLLTDWYKAQYDGADGDGYFTSATNVALTAIQIPSGDITNETKTVAEVAEAAGVTTEVVNNLAPADATDAQKKESLNKAMVWARANEKTTSDIATKLAFDENGGVDTNATVEVQQTTAAYLFNVADTEAAVSEANAKFRFNAITPGTIPSPAGLENANGKSQIQGKANLTDAEWGGTDNARFYRAILVK